MTGTGVVSFSGTPHHPRIFFAYTIVVAGIVFFIALALAPPVAAFISDLNNTPGPIGNFTWQTAVGQKPSITLPAIAPDDTPGFFIRQYTFSFQQENITIGTNVSAAVYYGAKNGNKFATTPSEESPESLAPDYYRAFVNDPAQDVLYADLISRFRAIRQEHRYTDDEYAELLTVFVQSLPYDNMSAAHPDTLSRFPAETLVDGTGDCDDKSVLLAGLLSREGYNVSLLLYIPEHHMAVGVESDCLHYEDTGYLYVETTGVSFMGDVPKRLNQPEKYVADDQEPGVVPLTSAPLVIRVGSGSRNFTSAGEIAYILAQKNGIDARIASLKAQINTTSRENPSRVRMLLEAYNTYAGIHNLIVNHRYDRAGMYRYLSAIMQPACRGQLPSTSGPALSSVPCDSPTVLLCSTPAGDISPAEPARDPFPAGYLPCPRGIWVQHRCVWQSVRQALVPMSG
jgi:hypothetical protein